MGCEFFLQKFAVYILPAPICLHSFVSYCATIISLIFIVFISKHLVSQWWKHLLIKAKKLKYVLLGPLWILEDRSTSGSQYPFPVETSKFHQNMASRGTPRQLGPMCPHIRRALLTMHYLFDSVLTLCIGTRYWISFSSAQYSSEEQTTASFSLQLLWSLPHRKSMSLCVVTWGSSYEIFAG